MRTVTSPSTTDVALTLKPIGSGPVTARVAQSIAALALAAGLAAGLMATGTRETAHAVALSGEDLTRLLRAMAVIKSMMAAAAAGAVLWRLTLPVTSARLGVYALAVAAMATGPGLIWNMAHVGAGALLLHAGLLATILILWRDQAVGQLLIDLIAARRLRQPNQRPAGRG